MLPLRQPAPLDQVPFLPSSPFSVVNSSPYNNIGNIRAELFFSLPTLIGCPFSSHSTPLGSRSSRRRTNIRYFYLTFPQGVQAIIARFFPRSSVRLPFLSPVSPPVPGEVVVKDVVLTVRLSQPPPTLSGVPSHFSANDRFFNLTSRRPLQCGRGLFFFAMLTSSPPTPHKPLVGVSITLIPVSFPPPLPHPCPFFSSPTLSPPTWFRPTG